MRKAIGGPPATVQIQAKSELVVVDAPEVHALLEAGHLESITGHGELDLEDGCFIRIEPGRRWVTYGLGFSLRRLIRDPLAGGGVVEIDPAD